MPEISSLHNHNDRDAPLYACQCLHCRQTRTPGTVSTPRCHPPRYFGSGEPCLRLQTPSRPGRLGETAAINADISSRTNRGDRHTFVDFLRGLLEFLTTGLEVRGLRTALARGLSSDSSPLWSRLRRERGCALATSRSKYTNIGEWTHRPQYLAIPLYTFLRRGARPLKQSTATIVSTCAWLLTSSCGTWSGRLQLDASA